MLVLRLRIKYQRVQKGDKARKIRRIVKRDKRESVKGRKVRYGADGHMISHHVRGGKSREYFWDYNTVEQVLLACLIFLSNFCCFLCLLVLSLFLRFASHFNCFVLLLSLFDTWEVAALYYLGSCRLEKSLLGL